MIITLKTTGNPVLDEERRLAIQGVREITEGVWARTYGHMSLDEFSAEYGPVPTLESLKRQHIRYGSDEDLDAWLDAQDEEATARSLAQGRY